VFDSLVAALKQEKAELVHYHGNPYRYSHNADHKQKGIVQVPDLPAVGPRTLLCVNAPCAPPKTHIWVNNILT
jgi:hypothetical protein